MNGSILETDSPQIPKTDCLVWGGYGWGNVGDFLTLAVGLADMKRRFGPAVAILDPHCRETPRLFPGETVLPLIGVVSPSAKFRDALTRKVIAFWVRAMVIFFAPLPANIRTGLFQWTHCPEWLVRLSRAKLLYLVGGGYLNDLYGLLPVYLKPVLLAKRMGIPVETAPLGLGPFRDMRAKGAMVRALSDVKLRVRDDASLAWAREAGLNTELFCDDGLRLREMLPEFRHLERGFNPRPRIGVCIFPQCGSEATGAVRAWWAALLTELKEHGDRLSLEGFCFHVNENQEYEAMRDLFEETGWSPDLVRPPESDFRDAVRGLARYDYVLSCRFHAVVTAQALAIPSCAFATGEYYKIKMESIARFDSRCQVVSPDTHTPNEVVRGLLDRVCLRHAHSLAE